MEAIQASFSQFGDQGDLLYRQFIEAVRQALAAGMTRLFAVSLGFSILAFLATFALKEIPLRQDEFYQEK